MNTTRSLWRPWLLPLVALAIGATTVACGANPTDAALLQANREARDNLKKPPSDRSVETLNVTRAAQLAANRRAIDDATEQRAVAPEEPAPLASDEPDSFERSTDELDAIAMAQDARLELANGNPERGRELLEASLDLHPTVDALEPLAELLAADRDDPAITRACRRTRATLRKDDGRVIELLQLCYTHHSSDDVDTALGWASSADRARLKVIVTP